MAFTPAAPHVDPRILRGGAAESPEDMVRARFSACRSKDAVFMAKTEVLAPLHN